MPRSMSSLLRWLAVALCAAIAGCCPARHLTTSHSDTTRVEVREHTVFVADTVYIEVPVEVQTAIAPDSSHLETTYATSEAYLTAEGLLHHSLSNKVGSLPVEVKREIIVRDSVVERVVQRKEIVEVERNFTKWERFRLDTFWVLSVLLIAALVFKFREILKVP